MLKTLLKEQEEEFDKKLAEIMVSADKGNDVEYAQKAMELRKVVKKHDAKIIKAVCEEMTGIRVLNSEDAKAYEINEQDSGYNLRICQEQEKAKELIKETL